MRKSKNSGKNCLDDLTMIPSSGNVFVDLGFRREEAENLLARTRLMVAIKQIIKENSWTQTEAAQFLGVNQSRISDLANGKIEKFSIDMLMKWLDRLGRRVILTVEQKTEVA